MANLGRWTIIQPSSSDSERNRSTNENHQKNREKMDSIPTCDKCKDWTPDGKKDFSSKVVPSIWNKPMTKMTKIEIDQIYGHFYDVHQSCKECNMTFLTRNLAIDHFETIHKKKGRCQYCKFYSFNISDLLEHLLKRHAKTEYDLTYKQADQIYHCDRCNEKIFGKIRALKWHILAVHFYCADCRDGFESKLDVKEYSFKCFMAF